MDELCYSPLDLAAIISSMNLGCRAQAVFIEQVWTYERPFIQKSYRDDKRRLIIDTSYWLTYLSDKPAIDAEFPMIQRDMMAVSEELAEESYIITDESGMDLFFKSARLRILYGNGKPYIRVKRRTLMGKYGYKRISPILVDYFNRCTYFYHLQPYVRGHIKCQIEDVGIDEMIMFRVV